VRGRLRFGASEDLVVSQLPTILREFRRTHPLVDLELTVGLSGVLHQQLHQGELDLVFGKRRPGETQGTLVWRDKLVWVSGETITLDPAQPVPLIVYPAPSITRAQAMETLELANRSWRITCTSGSLNGVRAAAQAGLGVVAHASSLIPTGLFPVPERFRLPDLGQVEVVLSSGRRTTTGAAAALAAAILAAGDRLQTSPE
jgi:DNA-binding transcriptional LysR family regulator